MDATLINDHLKPYAIFFYGDDGRYMGSTVEWARKQIHAEGIALMEAPEGTATVQANLIDNLTLGRCIPISPTLAGKPENFMGELNRRIMHLTKGRLPEAEPGDERRPAAQPVPKASAGGAARPDPTAGPRAVAG